MRRLPGYAAIIAAAALGVLVGAAAFGDTLSAGAQQVGTGAPNSERPVREPPDLVAIAIGQLLEEDGESVTVDLRAVAREGSVGGALRFYSEEHGYYNGGVRTLTVEDGVITVTGTGGLFPPEGGRMQVAYEAVFSSSDGHSVIHVRSRDGYEYTMEGTLEGLILSGAPESKVKTTE